MSVDHTIKKVEYAKPEILCRPTTPPKRPGYWVECSNCACPWGYFYNVSCFMGPPNYCPRCGAMNEDRSEQSQVKWPVGAISISEDGG